MSGLKTHRKMIFRVLLLIYLVSSVCAAEVKVAQSLYHAEENQNQTLEWTFPTKPGNRIFIFCDVLLDNKDVPVYLIEVNNGVPEVQKGPFAGRVQCDTDLLREGLLRLHVSNLRIQDSGVFKCQVMTEAAGGSAYCQLNVTAAVDEPKATVRPQPVTSPPVTSPHWRLHSSYIILLVVVCRVFFFPVFSVTCVFYRKHFKSSGSETNNSRELMV